MASAFDLDRFREVAFGRRSLPDHAIQTVEDAQKVLAELPAHDPGGSLAQLTALVRSMNETDSFTAARRARILMILDDAARPLWRALGARYLAPNGKPNERREGD